MGQTLPNGIYLPAEGERNCYDGLEGNWRSLDSLISTVAGKASATHTHGNITNDGKVGTDANKPLITGTDGVVQAGSFGNRANTFCEGNDSRLSDARTPVAHTHGKADVTDLFNSANTWSGDNTFSKAVGFTKVNATTLYAQNSRVELGDSGLSGDSYNQISFWDKNSDNLSYLRQTYTTDGTNAFNIFVRNKFLNGVPNTAGTVDYAYFGLTLNADKSKEGILRASFRPYDNNTYDLGSSSYQWNNLYAKGYYYNGTAWGLDQSNTWSADNTFTGNVTINKNSASPTTLNDNSLSFNELSNYIFFRTKGSSNVKSFNAWLWAGYLNGSAPNRYGRIRIYRASAPYGETGEETPDTSFSFIDVALHYKWVSLTDNVRFINDGTANACYPVANNATDLGTSDNKWKSFNGIDPGALGIFNPSATQDPIDVPNTWVTDGSAWNTLNVSNMGDGWICLTYKLCGANDYILARFGGANAITYPSMIFPATMLQGSPKYYLYVLMPVAKAMGNIYLEIKLDSNAVLVKHSFIPAYGTV